MIDTQIIETDMNKRMLNIDGANIDFELYTTKNSIIKLDRRKNGLFYLISAFHHTEPF